MADSPRILVVEDDPVNLLVITRMLRRLGHEPDVARNGLEAVEAAEKTAYDIIFMDIMMPELDGIQAARRIRRGPDGSAPMIFAVTATVMPEDRNAALQAGMNDYVTKPIQIDTIRNLLEGSDRRGQVLDFLDVQALDQLRESMGDAEFFAELIQEFIRNSDELVGEAEQGLQREDLEAIASAAHTLKSTSAAFGGRSLADWAARAEEAARLGQREDLRAMTNRLRTERTRLCDVLKNA